MTDTPHYDADIVMIRQDGNIVLTLGKSAQAVDRLDLTLLGDPSHLHTITSTNTDIHIAGQSDM